MSSTAEGMYPCDCPCIRKLLRGMTMLTLADSLFDSVIQDGVDRRIDFSAWQECQSGLGIPAEYRYVAPRQLLWQGSKSVFYLRRWQRRRVFFLCVSSGKPVSSRKDVIERLSMPYLQPRAARAMEYNFTCSLSPREERTAGTLAPITIAPNSAPQSLVIVL